MPYARSFRACFNRVNAKESYVFDLSRILSSRNSVERVAAEEKSSQKRLHDETEERRTPRKSKMVKSVWNVSEPLDVSSLNSEEIETHLSIELVDLQIASFHFFLAANHSVLHDLCSHSFRGCILSSSSI